MSAVVLLRRRALVLATVCCAVMTTPAVAQPPGGFSGGFRPNPDEIVDRMDENKNGKIDPEEMQGRSRFFLEGLARDNNLDLDKPIGKDELRDLLKARFGGGSSGSSGSSSNNSSSNGDRYRSSKFNEPAAPTVPGFGVVATAESTAKVPGFGPPPSGESWDVLKQKYNRRVIEEVEDSLDRYDRDKDGSLDREEVKNGRFRSDPMEYDKNKDGKLSRSELAVRYFERESGGGNSGGPPSGYGGGPPGGYGGGYSGGYGYRGPSSGGSSSGGNSSSGGSSNGGSSNSSSSKGSSSGGSSNGTSSGGSSSNTSSNGSSSSPPDTKALVQKQVDQIMGLYDSDKNGEIGKSEMDRVASAYKVADYNNSGTLTKDEIAKYILGRLPPGSGDKGSSTASSSSGGGSSDGKSSRYGSSRYGSSSRSSSASTASSNSDRKTYRFLAPAERLPKGLPDWFATSDADADGQIAMSEFSQAWDEAKAKEFAAWDRNGDGVITPSECVKKAP